MRAAFYRGTQHGLPGIFNRLVRRWERGPYSHCELIFSDGLAASSSFMDGGVRFKKIEFSPDRWDFIDLPDHLEAAARQWYVDHNGESYDVMGNVHFVVGFAPECKRKTFCSESMAAALGFDDAWRFGPNVLARALQRLVKSNDQQGGV